MTHQPKRADVQAIAVIDLGGQYCHMIGRRLRDLGIRADIFDHTVKSKQLTDYAGIILSGGPQSVSDSASPTIDRHILDLGRPVLGICYGHQLLAKLLGSSVARADAEFGRTRLELRKSDSLFRGTPKHQIVWMSHEDSVNDLPEGVELLAQTPACRVAAFGDFSRKLFGVQFHPEVVHTERGRDVLKNFGVTICGIRQREKIKDRVTRLLAEIRKRVGKRSVLFFVSGGVDSTVAFTLCARALPRKQVVGLYVDTGLMRKHETQELQSLLDSAGFGDRLTIRDESERFLTALRGVVDPEEKRHIIGRLFVEVQQEAVREYGVDHGDWLLGQGTIYPDTVESGGAGGTTALIKTHHNRCEEIKQLIASGRVVEPLAEFYKDEVRQIGKELGLKRQLTERWPFPGPGLAIRVLCGREEQPLRPIRLASRFKNYEAVHFPIRSVGVQGDGRTYSEVAAVRGRLDYKQLAEISTALCNIGRIYNRVITYVAGNVAEMRRGHVRPATMDPARIDLLREADYVVKKVMQAKRLTQTVWQFPTVLIPVSFAGGETIVLRPVNSEDGMTANFGRLPVPVLKLIGKKICEIDGIDAVFLDISDKPPATIEWE